jgi:peptide/nickel transport system ATP-binding protein
MSTPTALQVTGLARSFSRDGRPVAAVDDVSFAIRPGETLALAGPSGSGKSTVARLVMRLLEPDKGEISIGGQAVTALRGEALRKARRQFQMVFQDSNAAFNPRTTVGRALEDPLRLHDIVPKSARPQRVAELLEQVGLSPSLASRAIHEISGGQRQRVALARAIATRPSLIVLDEALSAIDSSVRSGILDLLVELQRSDTIAYLFISHDLALVRAISHRVAIMDCGRIVEIGETTALLDNPQSATAKALIAAVPQLKQVQGR